MGYLGDCKFFLQLSEVHAGRRTPYAEHSAGTHVFCLPGRCAHSSPVGAQARAHFLTHSCFPPTFTLCSSEARPYLESKSLACVPTGDLTVTSWSTGRCSTAEPHRLSIQSYIYLACSYQGFCFAFRDH